MGYSGTKDDGYPEAIDAPREGRMGYSNKNTVWSKITEDAPRPPTLLNWSVGGSFCPPNSQIQNS